ncbi:probable polygalacturonase [Selaginella moellendorffii]|uniref:probable polygalacturonase n=1 Tax=Selaginella moellendorffii TaxID=88036 RepID=UPI000D1CA594|nr:probable polygalacturonase [Selaginella moellendorffii]|eukprot:XP_002960960.2 probable polygalacturonase [Selaginella moellendorffii]
MCVLSILIVLLLGRVEASVGRSPRHRHTHQEFSLRAPHGGGSPAPAPGCCSPRSLPKRPHSVSITDFGAVGDGRIVNTLAFQNAIFYLKSFADKGGAQLYVPRGRWLTGSFNLTSHLTLFLEEGAVILGSQDLLEWPVIPALPSYGRGRELPGGRHISLIHGKNMVDVVITGANGTIDGQGSVWWDWFHNKTLDFTRGHLVELIDSRHITISNVTFKNSPFWTIHPVYCSDVLIQDVTILAPPYAPNIDGIDPDSSSNVCIRDCYISTGDDLISIKSGWDEHGINYGMPSTNVCIHNVSGQSPTSAGIAFGSEMSGGISDVFIKSVRVANSRSGIRIKTGAGRGGYITNISISDLQLENVSVAFDFTALYGGHPDDGYDPRALPVIRGISIRDVVGHEIGWAGCMAGLEEAPFRDLCFANVSLSVGAGAWNCSNTYGFSERVVPSPCLELDRKQQDGGFCFGEASSCFEAIRQYDSS